MPLANRSICRAGDGAVMQDAGFQMQRLIGGQPQRLDGDRKRYAGDDDRRGLDLQVAHRSRPGVIGLGGVVSRLVHLHGGRQVRRHFGMGGGGRRESGRHHQQEN